MTRASKMREHPRAAMMDTFEKKYRDSRRIHSLMHPGARYDFKQHGPEQRRR